MRKVIDWPYTSCSNFPHLFYLSLFNVQCCHQYESTLDFIATAADLFWSGLQLGCNKHDYCHSKDQSRKPDQPQVPIFTIVASLWTHFSFSLWTHLRSDSVDTVWQRIGWSRQWDFTLDHHHHPCSRDHQYVQDHSRDQSEEEIQATGSHIYNDRVLEITAWQIVSLHIFNIPTRALTFAGSCNYKYSCQCRQSGAGELRTGLFVRLLPWPSKDNVEVKVRQHKALCGALVPGGQGQG